MAGDSPTAEIVENSAQQTAHTPHPQSPPSEARARGRALLDSQYHLIQRRLIDVSRRSGLPEHEAEEFRSWALLKLVEDDSRILASWEGRSSFPTFLTVVLVNLMRDYRTRVWGKWRPTAAARRMGCEAILLEKFCNRDGLSLDEAIERMRTEHGVSLSRAELERMAASLTRRTERRRVGEEELRVLLSRLLPSLSPEDRLLLKLHYWDGLSMNAISPLLGRPQRELYSIRDKCLKKIRRSLEEAGLRPDRVRDLLGCSHLELAPDDL